MPLLANLVSPYQSTFIPDRWIAKNQLIVQELLHSFKRRKVKGGFVAVKVDLQKAYDRVNWTFLKEVLIKFGFHEIFINWIMQCMSTVSFSILLNGGISKHFLPTRGLRQRDPLSPYLFILCQEVPSRLIEREYAIGALHGVKMNPSGPAFTHVMYTDNLMLFAKASTREVKILDVCLEKYCLWSGQLINRDKSGLIFSKLVPRDRSRAIKWELNMRKKSLSQQLTLELLCSVQGTVPGILNSYMKGWNRDLRGGGTSPFLGLVEMPLSNQLPKHCLLTHFFVLTSQPLFVLLLGDFGGTPRKNQVTFLLGNHGINFVFPNTWVGWDSKKLRNLMKHSWLN